MKNIRAGSLLVDVGKVFVTANGTTAGASKINGLTITGGAMPTATLDLTNNAMAIDYTGASPASDIRGYLQSGFASGSWNGTGLISSTAGCHRGELCELSQDRDRLCRGLEYRQSINLVRPIG